MCVIVYKPAGCEMMPECADGLPYCADEDGAESMAAVFQEPR